MCIRDREYIVEGSMKLDDLNDRLELHLESEDYDSIGGLVIGLLDHLPEEGEDVVIDNIRLVVDLSLIHIFWYYRRAERFRAFNCDQ